MTARFTQIDTTESVKVQVTEVERLTASETHSVIHLTNGCTLNVWEPIYRIRESLKQAGHPSVTRL